MRVVSYGFALLATAWVILLTTAPHAGLGVPVSGSMYALGSLICHQQGQRSFHIGASQLPVCARCYGLYVGAAIGACAFALVRSSGRIRLDQLRVTLLAAAIPTVTTWTLEALGIRAWSNAARFIAALPLGMAMALTVNYMRCAQPQRSESRRPLTRI